MHACQLILALVLTVALQVAAQANPLTLFTPLVVYECQDTSFSWTGGSPSFQFFYAFGFGGIENDASAGLDIFAGETSERQITITTPNRGQPVRFKVVDSSGQASQQWVELERSDSCGTSSSTSSSYTLSSAPVTATNPPSIPWYPPPASSPPATSTQPPTLGGTAPTVTRTAPTTPPPEPSHESGVITLTEPFTTPSPVATPPGGTITVKPTDIPSVPTPANPSNPAEPNPGSPLNPTGSGGSGGSSGDGGSSDNGGTSGSGGSSPSEQGGSGNPAEGSTSAGGNQQTSRQGTRGQVPTQTASPHRNTTNDEVPKVTMSSQTIGAIVGTIVGAFVLFVGFLCFRWRRRHQQKHRPMAILPGPGNSGNDLTTEVIPPVYQIPPSMQHGAFHAGAVPPSPSQPMHSPARLLPSTKEARFLAPRPSTSSFETDTNPPSSINAGTRRSSIIETSRQDSHSIYPEEEAPVASTSHAGHHLQPPANSSTRTPLSLQELIGRELDNILASPDTYSPDSPLYTPSSLYGRDARSGFRIANTTEATSSTGGNAGALASSLSKRPLDTGSSHSLARVVTPDASIEGRPRATISRHELAYLADLVAARITRSTHEQQPEQARFDDLEGGYHGHGPPPSYI